ncbi:MAG: hypothetical protein RBS88_11405, partial [Spongiibacteraceae bacterium]|nr:hypothetical protein [Spongiibacteraceae bacterium]
MKLSSSLAADSLPASPLLAPGPFPPFDELEPTAVVPALEAVLAANRAAVEALLDELEQRGGAPDWEQLVAPLEELDDRLERVWAPVSHLNSVTSTPAWREAHEAALPLLTAYQTELGQNRR